LHAGITGQEAQLFPWLSQMARCRWQHPRLQPSRSGAKEDLSLACARNSRRQATALTPTAALHMDKMTLRGGVGRPSKYRIAKNSPSCIGDVHNHHMCHFALVKCQSPHGSTRQQTCHTDDLSHGKYRMSQAEHICTGHINQRRSTILVQISAKLHQPCVTGETTTSLQGGSWQQVCCWTVR